MIIFDIETEILPLEQIQTFMPPFDEAAVPGLVTGEFDSGSVKTGNLKDQAKIEAKIEEARAAHEAAKANAAQLVEKAKTKHLEDFLEDAALHPTTARVLVIGYYSPEKGKLVADDGDDDEGKILQGFWSRYQRFRAAARSLVGLNIHEFDLPFIVNRSWTLGIDVPQTAFEQIGNRIYWDRVFLDIRARWLLGRHPSRCKSDFDTIGKALSTGGKNGNGAEFAKKWREDREAAIAYLTNDLKQPAAWAERMGVMA